MGFREELALMWEGKVKGKYFYSQRSEQIHERSMIRRNTPALPIIKPEAKSGAVS